LATTRFAALAALPALLRLAEFALRNLARLCAFDRFLRLVMIDPPGLVRAPQRTLMPITKSRATDRGSYQQIAA
jgi:hypothetical protein